MTSPWVDVKQDVEEFVRDARAKKMSVKDRKQLARTKLRPILKKVLFYAGIAGAAAAIVAGFRRNPVLSEKFEAAAEKVGEHADVEPVLALLNSPRAELPSPFPPSNAYAKAVANFQTANPIVRPPLHLPTQSTRMPPHEKGFWERGARGKIRAHAGIARKTATSFVKGPVKNAAGSLSTAVAVHVKRGTNYVKGPGKNALVAAMAQLKDGESLAQMEARERGRKRAAWDEIGSTLHGMGSKRDKNWSSLDTFANRIHPNAVVAHTMNALASLKNDIVRGGSLAHKKVSEAGAAHVKRGVNYVKGPGKNAVVARAATAYRNLVAALASQPHHSPKPHPVANAYTDAVVKRHPRAIASQVAAWKHANPTQSQWIK